MNTVYSTTYDRRIKTLMLSFLGFLIFNNITIKLACKTSCIVLEVYLKASSYEKKVFFKWKISHHEMKTEI